jgi:hypothetical protein
VQRLAGRRLVRDVREDYQVARLRDGALQFVTLTPERADMTESAGYLTQFGAALEEDATPLSRDHRAAEDRARHRRAAGGSGPNTATRPGATSWL